MLQILKNSLPREGLEPTLPYGKRILSPEGEAKILSNLLNNFLSSRRQGTSPRTLQFYRGYLNLAKPVISIGVKGQDIEYFLDSLECSNGGKHAYFRALRAFYNWLYSPKSSYKLNPQDNPILAVESPKVEKRILPSLTIEQLDYLIEQAECVRDKAIISLFADSGLRLSELANIKVSDIDWQHRLIKVICKGNKEGLAPFGKRTEALLRELAKETNSRNMPNKPDKLWNISNRQIQCMLHRLALKTGHPCNPHTFRRTFASILAKRGVDSLHIMRLGRWQSISMVDRYTRSVKFEDSLKLYSDIV